MDINGTYVQYERIIRTHKSPRFLKYNCENKMSQYDANVNYLVKLINDGKKYTIVEIESYKRLTIQINLNFLRMLYLYT